MKIIRNNNIDPAFNLATEEYILKYFDADEPVFMLWRNNAAVIVGKNQNTFSEIDLDFVKENNVRVIRRLTGGGAVFHDLGNVNFTFMENEQDGHFNNYTYYTTDLVDFLAAFGVQAELSGRNDILIDGKKICGNAQCVSNHKVMHHGCILYSADLSRLTHALKAKKEKFDGKSVKSVASRVTNIVDHMDDKMEVTAFLDAFERFIAERYACAEYRFTAQDIESIQQLTDEKYDTWEWNFGRSPDYNFMNTQKFDFGLIEIHLMISAGMLHMVKISGDFFGKRDISEIETALTGHYHKAEEIEAVLGKYDISQYISGCTKETFVKLFTA